MGTQPPAEVGEKGDRGESGLLGGGGAHSPAAVSISDFRPAFSGWPRRPAHDAWKGSRTPPQSASHVLGRPVEQSSPGPPQQASPIGAMNGSKDGQSPMGTAGGGGEGTGRGGGGG